MEERILIEVEATDAGQLLRALDLPEDEIYVELVPGVKLFHDNTEVRRGGSDILPYLMTFIIAVTAPLATDAIRELVKKLHKGDGHSITKVTRCKVTITMEEETIEKVQKLLEKEKTN